MKTSKIYIARITELEGTTEDTSVEIVQKGDYL